MAYVPATLDLTFALNSATTGGTIILDNISISRNLQIPMDAVGAGAGGGGGYRGRWNSRSSN